MGKQAVNELYHFRNEQVVLYKRGKYWQARLKLVTGKWHRISCKTNDLKKAKIFACEQYDEIKFREKHKMALLTKKFVSVANVTIDNLQTQLDSGYGKVSNLDTNSEGKGVLSIEIAKGIKVQTWNNAFSDLVAQSLIEPNSDLFQQLLNIKVGATVKFSGEFIEGDADAIEEQSMSLSGSMRSPEFTCKFTAIEVLND